jgi:hypothetical protein
MNERMQELYDQAFTLGTSGYSNGELDVGKFAELIVQEILNVALYGDEHAQARDNVKTLFGVEND